MADDWKSVSEEDLVIRPKITADVNKWKGEDDDDKVMESWEDVEEKKDEGKPESKVPTTNKPNKALKSKKTEQERLAEEEEEEKRLSNLTPEEKLAEKLRLQKIQEESDLKSALETFGVSNVGEEEFKEFGATLGWKLSQYKNSPHFPQFAEDLVRSICVHLSASDIKKVKINIESLHSEKLKMEKQTTKKAGSKGKVKATIRAEADDLDVYSKYGNDFGDAEDYDDFM